MRPQEEVALASRVLYLNGVVDAFGHVSRRCPDRRFAFLMSRSMAPALVEPGDVLPHDLDGELLDPSGQKVFLERFIHAAIYRARPDVNAVVHSHAPSVVPFTVAKGAEVRPVSHMCGFLAGTRAPFDIADHVGPASDLLIRNQDLGAALCMHLGKDAVVLMRGHGFTTVGATVAEAVFRAVYTKLNCELQRAALALGEPHYLSEGEAEACEQATRGQIDRAWQLWVKEARAAQACSEEPQS